MSSIAVDARMLGPSGIGTYLEALLPRLVHRLEGRRLCLLGDAAALASRPWTAGATLVPCRAGIYAPHEQASLALATPSEATTFWSPHVNAPVGFRGRLVVTVHDAYYLLPEARAEVRLDKWLYLRAMYAAVARRADVVVTVSAFTAAELEARLGLDPARIVVIHNGLDADFRVRPEVERPHPRPYVLFVGNARPHKNLARLVAAFERIAGEVEHDLVIVGRLYGAGPSQMGTRVHQAGSVDREALRAWYAHASALAMPSLYEGFGLPPLEAMALGTPVLAARAASLPEVCADAAHYCDPRDVEDIAAQLRRVLTDVPLRAQLIAAGRRRVDRFSWDEAAEAIAAQL